MSDAPLQTAVARSTFERRVRGARREVIFSARSAISACPCLSCVPLRPCSRPSLPVARPHLLSHLGRGAGAGAVRARRPAAPQLRVRRRHRGVPAGAADRSRRSRWPTGARRSPTISRSGTTRTSTRRAPCSRGWRRRAPRGRPRRRPLVSRPTSTPWSACSATATRATRDRAYAESHGRARAPVPRRRERGGVLRARAARHDAVGRARHRRLAEGRRHRRRRAREESRAPRRRALRAARLRRRRACGDGAAGGAHLRRASPRRRATRGTCRRTSSCRSACGTRRSRRTNRRSPRRSIASSGWACRWRRPTSTASAGCTTSTCSRGGSRRRAS